MTALHSPPGTEEVPYANAATAVGTYDHSARGVVFLFIKIIVFSLQDVIIKWMSSDYPVHEIVLIRSIFAIIPILLITHFTGGLHQLGTRHFRLHFIRSALLFATFMTFYLSLAALPLAEAVTLSFTTPLFITILSVVMLGEKVSFHQWIAVFVGFLGVICMLNPGAEIVNPAAFLTLASAFLYALASIITRQLGNTESGISLTFYPTLFYIVFSAIIALALSGSTSTQELHASLAFLLHAWKIPSRVDLSFIFLLGLIAASGFYCLSQAYRLAPPSTLAPFEYFAVFLGVVWGYMVWGEVPEVQAIVGIVLIVGSGLYSYVAGKK
jgi:S-adenosylmethionine uptake transporter